MHTRGTEPKPPAFARVDGPGSSVQGRDEGVMVMSTRAVHWLTPQSMWQRDEALRSRAQRSHMPKRGGKNARTRNSPRRVHLVVPNLSLPLSPCPD